MKKYLCIGGEYPVNKKVKHNLGMYTSLSTTIVKAQWLPRWYGVPYEECEFATYKEDVLTFKETYKTFVDLNVVNNGIRLTYRPNGDYKEHLKVLKTKKLLES